MADDSGSDLTEYELTATRMSSKFLNDTATTEIYT
jgi:hypothetical protein